MFAQQLLKKGYVELTPDTARMYGYGFSATGITLSSSEAEIQRMINHSGEEYIDVINNPMFQEELDYDRKILAC